MLQVGITWKSILVSLLVLNSVLKFNSPLLAGATLMAAGASSPELFSAILSLFVTHSALGLGTIVGSEIFNQVSEMPIRRVRNA
jgi:Ca2+/Na+ antiporter